MTVDPQSALHADHDGQRYFFCRAGCRERFQQGPARYVSGLAAPSDHHKH